MARGRFCRGCRARGRPHPVHAIGCIVSTAIRSRLRLCGAFGLFDRNILETVGGYWTDTVGEDFELTLRLHHYFRDRDEPYRIVFVPDPVCWTEVPEQFSRLSRQRRRWQRGLWQGLRRHEGMMLKKRYGAIGMVSMPHFALFEFLSPVFALGGLVITIVLGVLSQLSLSYVIAYAFVTLGLSVLLTLTAITVEEFGFNHYRRRRDIFRLLAYTVVESICFHPLHDVWRAIGYVDIARGTTSWGAQQRRGFAPLGDQQPPT